MKQIFINLFIILMLNSCKGTNNENKALILKETSSKNTEKKRDSIRPIKIYNILYDSIQNNDSEQLSSFNESLKNLYKDASLIKDAEYINRRLKDYQSKRFAKSLSNDFDNNNFTKTTQINVSFLIKEQQKIPGDIRVEEWYFKDKAAAISCIKSLNSYREREIHFNFISWIWIRQKNKLFFVFTTDFMVDSEPMQTIKLHLLDIIKKEGKEYDIIEMH